MGHVVPEPVPHCPVHLDVPLEPRRRGWCCPACARRVLSYRQWPPPPAAPAEGTDPALAALPWLVAAPLAAARAAGAAEARLPLARTAALASVRLAALLLLCDALARGDRTPYVGMGTLAIPGWRPWLELARQLADAADTRAARLGGLVAGWRLLEAGGEVDLLFAMRPAERGPSAPPDIELATVEHIASTLFGSGPELWRAVDGDWSRAIPLRGPAAGTVWRADSPPDPSATPARGLVAAWDEGRVLPLEPFVLPGELVAAGEGSFTGEPARALLMATADGGLYQGLAAPVHCSHEWESAPHTSGHVSRQDAAPLAAAQTRRRLAALRRRPWHAGPFLPRPAVEERLASALRHPGRAVVVAGEGGAGATVLLARLAAHLLQEAPEQELSAPLAALASGPAEDPDVVALVSGPGIWARAGSEAARLTLARVVASALGAGDRRWRDLEELCAHFTLTAPVDRRLGRKVWLLLDGLDEDEHGAELLAALDTALPELAACPWLRLVVSLDLVTCRRLMAAGERRSAWFHNLRFVTTFADPATDERRPWLEIPPLSRADEVPALYTARQGADPARACPLPATLLPPTASAALTNPLQAQLFHESHRWLATPSELDLHALMAGFLLRQGEACGFSAAELAERLWAAGSGSLTLADVWTWTERWIASMPDPAQHAAFPSPVEALLEGGVLVPPEVEASWPPPPTARASPAHVVVAEALLQLAARREVEEPRAPLGAAIAAGLTRPPGRWSLRHELGAALGSLAARLAEAGEFAALEPLLCAGEREVAAIALARSLGVATGGKSGIERWARAAAADAEACLRLLRACAVAGLNETAEEPLLSFQAQLLTAAVAHLPDDPALRRQLAALRLAAAGRATCAADTVRLLREARSNLEGVRSRWPADPDTLAPLATTLVRLGEVAALLGHTDEARAALRRGVPLVRTLLAAEPGDAEARRQLAAALVALATLGTTSNHSAEAERLLGEATSVVNALCAAAPERTEHRRLWGRLLHASGLASRAGHRLQRAFSLLEQAAATLGWLAGTPGTALDRLAYARAVLDFAALAAEERATQAARAALDEGLRAFTAADGAGWDAALAAAEAELVASLARLARDHTEEVELWRRAAALLAPLAGEEGAPPRLAALGREVRQRLAELEAGGEPGRSGGGKSAPERPLGGR